jgi:hypothetical protein
MTNTPDMPVKFTDPGQAYEDRLEPVDPRDVPATDPFEGLEVTGKIYGGPRVQGIYVRRATTQTSVVKVKGKDVRVVTSTIRRA